MSAPNLSRIHVPTDDTAERAVLGAMLASERAAARAFEALHPADFYGEAHQAIFARAMDMMADGQAVDLLTLTSALRSAGKLDAAGGTAYVAGLAEGLPDPANVEHYARLVRDAAKRRVVQRLSVDLAAGSGNPAIPIDELIEDAARRVAELAGDTRDGESALVGDVAREEFNRIRDEGKAAPAGLVETGLAKLDALLRGGLHPGQLVVLAARTGVGKTALAVQVALHTAKEHAKRVLFVSLEQSRQEIAQRALAQTARVEIWRLRSARLDGGAWAGQGGDWPRVELARDALAGVPLEIMDRGGLTPASIRAHARARQLRRGLDLLVVDYLQLLRSGERHANRVEEVGAISRALKLLARDLGVPVLALSQLNRQPEDRPDGEPRLSDLRESGSIENDADVVVLLHRRIEGETGRIRDTRAIVAKHRQGPTGRANLVFHPEFFTFEPGTPEPQKEASP